MSITDFKKNFGFLKKTFSIIGTLYKVVVFKIYFTDWVVLFSILWLATFFPFVLLHFVWILQQRILTLTNNLNSPQLWGKNKKKILKKWPVDLLTKQFWKVTENMILTEAVKKKPKQNKNVQRNAESRSSTLWWQTDEVCSQRDWWVHHRNAHNRLLVIMIGWFSAWSGPWRVIGYSYFLFCSWSFFNHSVSVCFTSES